MTMYRLERSQDVGGAMSEVFSFFRDPKNLEALTPPWLRFRVRMSSTQVVQLGTEIEYDLTWKIFPMRWRSRISEFEDGRHFADEMLRGPYAHWYHRHIFAEIPGGVRMVDIVEYRLPFGVLGRLAHRTVVRRQLEAIFHYRQAAIEELFAVVGSQGAHR